MYVKSMVLDGFKSYGKRIEINDFDKEFNAITGLNGSGKSNILDAICFVLGLTNLTQVRASSLQDLVYKCGQAGVTKATVTITFDNRDRSTSPMGCENFEEITVTRQVVIGGKNKYMINGSNVPNKRVHDMFCSVQLNVNKPHFLIMQGRITKVLNMKPPEILSLIEEAAGTSMYETKKQAAYKTIEKKDAKLKEINAIVQEELAPKLRKLKEEQSQFLEFQRVERELQHCRRIHVAWKYVSALESSANAKNEVEKADKAMEEMQKQLVNGKEEILNIAKQIEEISQKREAEEGSKLAQIEHDLKTMEKEERKLTAETNSDKERLKAQKTLIQQLRNNIADDEAALTTKAKELEKCGELFKNLKEKCERDSQEFVTAQERYHKISDGLLLSETGENATLEQQLIEANQNASKAKTEIQQCEMTMKHSKEQLSKKQKEMQGTANDYRKDSKDLENMEKELKNIDQEITKLDYREEKLEDLQGHAQQLSKDIRILRDKIDGIESQHPRLRFHYQNPEPGFKRESVKGLVCKLINVEDKQAAYALEVAVGERLYNVIVDNEITSKKLLQNGQLQQRVTIIPLNKINGRSMDPRTIELAQRLVGEENVQPALSLITFPNELTPAMTWIFGQIFICKDMEIAKKVTFHDKIMKKSVTLDGDVFDPTGTLSGGAKSKSGSILLQLVELKAIQNELRLKEQTLAEVNQKIANNSETAKKYHELKRRFDSRNYEVGLVRQRLQLTSHHKLQEEVNELQSTIENLTRTLEAARILERESVQRAAKIEGQLKNATKIREQQLKTAEMEMQEKQKVSKKSREQWENHERESETLHLEITELQKMIETGKKDLIQAEEKFATMKETADQIVESLKVLRARVSELQDQLKAQKEIINRQNKEIQKLRNREEDIKNEEAELKLQIQKLKHEIAEIQSKAADCVDRVRDLLRKYEWIEQDKAYFGEPGGMYDFNVNKPDEMGKKLQQLEQVHQKLSRNINARSMSLLGKEEDQYNSLMKKKTIVENDKKKILETINRLDQKKKETLLRAWEQVNRDFGSIFSSLLPGASAKLQPPENQTVLDGLEVKIGFSGIWKESLGELSGGQRSLVALSLILAMLLFKPAPLYILDEVDAALDLSHTQNIGTMLKQHFKRSQFIIVSLKDGMFNNANVLFRTKFVDGLSTITRTTNVNK